MHFILFLFLQTLLFITNSQENYHGPIFGIISIPSDLAQYPADQWSYFPTSYAKFIESGGAQVIPIQYDLPRENLTALLNSVNGVLFPGGGSNFTDAEGNLTPIAETLKYVVEYVIQQNTEFDNYYPLWGTCLGFEVIAMIIAENFSILSKCEKCIDVSKNNFLNTNYTSKLFAGLPEDLQEKLSYANLSHFSEEYKLDVTAFENSPPLMELLTPIAYTYDAAGVKYISAYESPKIPIYATQFHQEGSTYGWGGKTTNHGMDAVRLQQYLSNFLVSEALKNKNIFADFQSHLVENCNVTMVANSSISPAYLFPALSQKTIINLNDQ